MGTATLSFDSGELVDFLKEGGFEEGRAKTLAKALRFIKINESVVTREENIEFQTSVQKENTEFQSSIKEKSVEFKSEIASDITTLRNETKEGFLRVDAEFEKIKGEMKEGFGNTKAELIKWMAGMLIAQAASIVALLKLFSV